MLGRTTRLIGVFALLMAASFSTTPGTTGNLERNFLNGPLYVNWDAGLMKNFRFTETTRFQVRVEAFNLLNRANFFIGNASFVPAGTSFDINSANFGRVNSTFDPRILQFVGRFEF